MKPRPPREADLISRLNRSWPQPRPNNVACADKSEYDVEFHKRWQDKREANATAASISCTINDLISMVGQGPPNKNNRLPRPLNFILDNLQHPLDHTLGIGNPNVPQSLAAAVDDLLKLCSVAHHETSSR